MIPVTAGSNLLPAVLLFSTESCSRPATRITPSPRYDANNRLLESEKDDGYTETVTEYSYDDNGNQVEKEVWIDNSFDSSETSVYNGFNQLVSVSNDDVDAEYTYAPSGLRLTKTVDNEQIYYINDGDNVIAELYEDEVTAYYLRGRNLYGSFIGNDEYFYLYNAHGDVVNLTDTSGYIEHTYRYDAFGNEREPESSDNNPFRYCGEYYDGETGSYYLRARYYDPVIGRFTQQDSYRGDTNDPLSLNYYVYCASNPLAYHDPSGNYWETAFDIASFGISLGDFLSNPTLYNASFLAWDAIALVSPAPSVGLIKGIDEVDDVFALLRRTDDSIDAVKAVKEVASSKVLRTNMIKNGSEVPKYKHAAHHIVAGNAKEASYARSVLEKFNISINDAVNGVFLPTEKNVSNAMYHPSLHTKAYYEQVNKMLSKANSSDDVRAILEDIGEMLEYGDFNVLK